MLEQKIQMLEQTVNRLTDLLDEETQNLLDHRLDKIADLAGQKRELSDYLENAIGSITSLLVTDMSEDIKKQTTEHLSRIAHQCKSTLEKNQEALTIAEEAQTKVINAIREAVQIHQGPKASYTEQGIVTEGASSHPAMVFNHKA